jgi:hypothetical protein
MDKKFIFLSSVFFLLFGLFISMIVLNQPLRRLTRAKEEFIPSSKTSMILAWPLSSPADGKTNVNVNVFVRNMNNLPLSNKKVNLITTLGQIKELQSVTDKNGKSTFILTSDTPGIAQLKAVVDNQIELEQKLTVKFE